MPLNKCSMFIFNEERNVETMLLKRRLNSIIDVLAHALHNLWRVEFCRNVVHGNKNLSGPFSCTVCFKCLNFCTQSLSKIESFIKNLDLWARRIIFKNCISILRLIKQRTPLALICSKKTFFFSLHLWKKSFPLFSKIQVASVNNQWIQVLSFSISTLVIVRHNSSSLERKHARQ